MKKRKWSDFSQNTIFYLKCFSRSQSHANVWTCRWQLASLLHSYADLQAISKRKYSFQYNVLYNELTKISGSFHQKVTSYKKCNGGPNI